MIEIARFEVLPGVYAVMKMDTDAVKAAMYDQIPSIVAKAAKVSTRERIREGKYANGNSTAKKVMFSLPHSWKKDEHYVVVDHEKYKKIKYGSRVGMRALFKSGTLRDSITAEVHHKNVTVHCVDYGLKHFKGGTYSVPNSQISKIERIFGIKIIKGKVRVAKREFSTWGSLEEKRLARMMARAVRKVERQLN